MFSRLFWLANSLHRSAFGLPTIYCSRSRCLEQRRRLHTLQRQARGSGPFGLAKSQSISLPWQKDMSFAERAQKAVQGSPQTAVVHVDGLVVLKCIAAIGRCAGLPLGMEGMPTNMVSMAKAWVEEGVLPEASGISGSCFPRAMAA